MEKYLDIVNWKSLWITVVCLVVSFLCIRFNLGYNLNLIIFTIAVVFPLVFTIREAFRRRQLAIRYLSRLKASISSFYFSLENNTKFSDEEKLQIHLTMNDLSEIFIESLIGNKNIHISDVRKRIRQIYVFVDPIRSAISGNASLKLMRFVQNIQESVEALNAIKIHGTPVSLRAYCLVFIFIFPFIFTPSLVFHLKEHPTWLIYSLSVLHGFILISLYNLQSHIEDPFDQIGLDDIQLTEFQFTEGVLPQSSDK